MADSAPPEGFGVDNGRVSDLVLYFPYMHPELVTGAIPLQVKFLDPGLVRENEAKFWRPGNLPLNHAGAKRYVGESLRFGEQFKEPEELRYFSAAAMEDFYSDSAMDIRSDLSKKNTQPAPDLSVVLLGAQQILLLGWTLEERLLEMLRLEGRLAASSTAFASVLGLDEEDKEAEAGRLGGAMASVDMGGELERAKGRILESVCAFLPEDGCLFTHDADLLQSFREAGIQPIPAPEGFLDTQAPLVEYRGTLSMLQGRRKDADTGLPKGAFRIFAPLAV